jgi:ferric-dicitrate binding protein FerR (iron transport regulator)
MSRKRTNAAIPEAVRWFHRFRMKGPTALSPEESAEWARWAAKKEHLAAFQRAEQLWDELQHLKKRSHPTQQELVADDYDPEQSISEWLIRAAAKGSSR